MCSFIEKISITKNVNRNITIQIKNMQICKVTETHFIPGVMLNYLYITVKVMITIAGIEM